MESHWCVFSHMISDLLKGSVTSVVKVNYRGASEGLRGEATIITQVVLNNRAGEVKVGFGVNFEVGQ